MFFKNKILLSGRNHSLCNVEKNKQVGLFILNFITIIIVIGVI